MNIKEKVSKLIDYDGEMHFYHQCTMLHLMDIIEREWISLDPYLCYIDELYDLYIKGKTDGSIS